MSLCDFVLSENEKGTPMNTSHDDLRNQLKFLGFDHVDKTFEQMTTKHSRCSQEIRTNYLMYFLRPIMIRHSQEQKYRGTNTTLMSLPPKVSRAEFMSSTSICHMLSVYSLMSISASTVRSILMMGYFRRKGMKLLT